MFVINEQGNMDTMLDKYESQIFTLGCEKEMVCRCDLYSRYFMRRVFKCRVVTIQYKYSTKNTIQYNTIQYNSNAERLLARITFVTSGGEKLDGVCLALVKKTQPFFINIISV